MPVAGCRLREGFFCFVMMGCIQSAVVHPAVVQPAVIRTAIFPPAIIHPAIALHIVEGFDVEK